MLLCYLRAAEKNTVVSNKKTFPKNKQALKSKGENKTTWTITWPYAL
jgi:hypothetical protein